MNKMIKNALYIIIYFLIIKGTVFALGKANLILYNGYNLESKKFTIEIAGALVLSVLIFAIVTLIVRYNFKLLIAGFIPVMVTCYYGYKLDHLILAALGLAFALFMFWKEFGGMILTVGLAKTFNSTFMKEWQRKMDEATSRVMLKDTLNNSTFDSNSKPKSYTKSDMGYVYGSGYGPIYRDGYITRDYAGNVLKPSPYGGWEKK